MTLDSVRYLNKNNNANERENFSKWWREQINHYGTLIDYYTSGYSLSGSQDYIYGEDPTSGYTKTGSVVMLTNITNDSLMLSKFGIMADCDMTAVVHIQAYYDQFGCNVEPKAGDLIRLTEYGNDRPGLRSAPVYEITERDDEYLPMTNPLIGHYLWYIKCKRFEYSFEPGIEQGAANIQVNDTGTYGRASGGDHPALLSQPYPQSVQQDVDNNIFYNPDTEQVLQLIQQNQQDPQSTEEGNLADFIPDAKLAAELNIKPIVRPKFSAYDYFDNNQ